MLDFLGKAADTIIGMVNANKNRDMMQQQAANNAKMQMDFAQNGVQWRVADAQAAGIHPLAALGAQLSSFSPVSLGDLSSATPSTKFGEMGQDLSRAISATRTQTQRDQAFTQSARDLELVGKNLDNQLKATELASAVRRTTGAQVGPPMPGPEVVPEAKKHEDRPLMAVGGSKIKTSSGSGNIEDTFEKRYGEPGEWLGAPLVMYDDAVANWGQPHTWPKQFMDAAWSRLKDDVKFEAGNFKRFFKK